MHRGLLPIVIDRKTGYIDTDGNTVIDPRFEDGQPFADGLAWVKSGPKWGAIDLSGEPALAAEFEQVFPFCRGFAKVVAKRDGDDVYRVIDRHGAWVGDVFAAVSDFTDDGLALAQTLTHTVGIIDQAGDWVLPAKYPVGTLGDFHHGVAWRKHGDAYGYIDRSGAWTIEPRFEQPGDFGEHVAPVSIGGKLALIDRDGAVVAKTPFEGAFRGRFTGALLRVRSGKYWGWIDDTGAVVVEPELGFAYDFVGAYAQAGNDVVSQGLLDRTGEYCIRPCFYAVVPTEEGLARVYPDETKRDTYGYTTPQGKWVWVPEALGKAWNIGGYLLGCHEA